MPNWPAAKLMDVVIGVDAVDAGLRGYDKIHRLTRASSSGSDIGIEELTIAHEGIVWTQLLNDDRFRPLFRRMYARAASHDPGIKTGRRKDGSYFIYDPWPSQRLYMEFRLRGSNAQVTKLTATDVPADLPLT